MDDSITTVVKLLRRIWHGLRHDLATAVPRSCDMEVASARSRGWHIDAADAYCPRCAASTGRGGYTSDGCSSCVGKPVAWDLALRLSAYVPPVDRWIVAMKFHHDWVWCRWFGRRLAEQIEAVGQANPSIAAGRVVVCPVPMHRLRRIRRGYNQAELMALALAAARGWPMVRLLRRTRYTRPQIAMSLARREANVRGSFRTRRIDLSGWDVWLVDDVKTSGATLTVCTRRLRQVGARQINIAVVAVADRSA